MSPSFGFNRQDTEENYEDPTELLHSFIDSVSKNGNLLLNVGPTGEDASIPSMQRTRLDFLGHWLADNGDAIYQSRPWITAESQTTDGLEIRLTRHHETLFVTLLGEPTGKQISFSLAGPLPDGFVVKRVAGGLPLDAKFAAGRLTILLDDPLPSAPAHSFSITPVE